jgi:hypothetical protein
MTWALLTSSNVLSELDAISPGPGDTSNIGLLHVSGLRMQFADGRDYDGIHVTAFREMELHMRWKLQGNQTMGDQLKRWMDWKVATGFTGSRVFSYHKPPNVRPFDPKEFGSDYYPGIANYLDFSWQYNQRVHFVLFLGAVPPDDPFLDYDSQYAHAEKCLQQIRPRADVCEVEVANEGEDNNMAETVNRFPASLFAGVMAARTRILQVNWDPAGQPYDQLDWLNHHPERKGGFDSTRKFRDGELITRTPGYWKPLWFDEPEKAGEDGARTTNPAIGVYVDQYAQNAAAARIFGVGLTVHGAWENLQQCLVPEGEVAACCANAVKMWRAGVIPCEAQEWGYCRDEDAPIVFVLRFPHTEEEARAHGWNGSGNWGDYTVRPEGCKHAYAMIGGDWAAAVSLEPGSSFVLQAKPGWKIVRADPTKVSCYLERA